MAFSVRQPGATSNNMRTNIFFRMYNTYTLLLTSPRIHAKLSGLNEIQQTPYYRKTNYCSR